jgi:alkyldihydroxyacetonephosphate synthase
VTPEPSVNQPLVDRLTAIAGEEHVRTPGTAADWWPLALKGALAPPLGSAALRVSPADAAETARIVAACASEGAVLVPFGAGSGVVGSAVPEGAAVLLDLGRLNEIGAIDRVNSLVTVGAGVLGGVLEANLNDQGFTTGLYPQSLELATVGGMIATRASGTFSGHYGAMEARLAGVEVVLADGTRVQTPHMPRWALGPELPALFLGSEGTLGVVTAATLRLNPLPERRLLRAVRFPALESGFAAIREMLHGGIHPAVVRLYDAEESGMIRATTGHTGEGCVLLLAFDGPARLADLTEDLALDHCRRHGADDLGREPAERWNANRLRVPAGFAALREPGVMADFIDVQAPWDSLFAVYTNVRAALLEHCGSAVAHFSHVYPQGSSIYFVIRIDAPDDAEAIARYHRAWEAAMTATLAAGGTIAHHHGVGLARAAWLPESLGTAWPVWERLKAAFDPAGILNPGKLGLPVPAGERRDG